MKDNRHISRLFYGLTILVLLTPLLQYTFGFVKEIGLHGAFENKAVIIPKASIENIKKGNFQSQVEDYWQRELGLKNYLIRINNQLNFTLFNKTNANDVIVGNNNMLFPESYIKSFYGLDNIGKDSIQSFLRKVKFVQDTLHKEGKLFFMLVVPGKASIYKENIPNKYEEIYGLKANNYDLLIEESKKLKVKLFDARAYIEKNKEQFKYPIFPKNGVHWTGNTVAKVSDTLIRFISENSTFNFPVITLSPGETTIKNYRFTDYDIGQAMNLVWNVSDEIIHYPEIHFDNKPKKRATFLGIGDSFIQSFYGFYPILDSVFSPESQIWYYNKVIDWPVKFSGKGIKTMWLDKAYEIDKADVIVLEMTEENIRQTGYGFVEDLYKFFTNEDIISDNMLPLYDKLKDNEEIEKRAEALYELLGYSKHQLKETLIKNKLKNQWLINFDYDAEVKNYINAIKADSAWLEKIKQKAIQNNLTIDEAIKKDALWMVNEKLGIN